MVYWELISARDVTPLVIHHSHLSEDTLGQLPFVNGLALEKISHAQLLRLFFGRLDPAKKHLRRSFFGAKKTKKLHQCTSMKSRITSEIPWLNVFSSACLEVYATLSTCAACS